jgi:hypothetical protein
MTWTGPDQLPFVLLHSPQLYDFPLHPTDYTCTDTGCAGGAACRVMFQSLSGEDNMFILGDTFIHTYYSIFDAELLRVGLARYG